MRLNLAIKSLPNQNQVIVGKQKSPLSFKRSGGFCNRRQIGYTIYMDNNFAEKNRQKKMIDLAVRVGLYLFVFYIVFLLGRSIWVNFNLKKSISKLQGQITELDQEKKALNNLIVYYKSDAFKELEARKKLGLKAPDEKVMLLAATPSTESFPEEVAQEKKGVAGESTSITKANWRLWWDFFTR